MSGTISEQIQQLKDRLTDLQASGREQDFEEIDNLLVLLDVLEKEEEDQALMALSLAESTHSDEDLHSFFSPSPSGRTEDEFSLGEFEGTSVPLPPPAPPPPSAGSSSGLMRTLSFEDVSTDFCPFDVKCPFCTERRTMPANDLPAHTMREHSTRKAEKHHCPICFLENGKTIPEKVFLVDHLLEQHGYMIETEEPKAEEGFIVSVPDEDIDDPDQFCPYCYEPFVKGRPMIIMWCTHKYHKDCIEEWWKQKQEQQGKCMWKCGLKDEITPFQ